jgi:hypothetical protein
MCVCVCLYLIFKVFMLLSTKLQELSSFVSLPILWDILLLVVLVIYKLDLNVININLKNMFPKH